MSWSHLVGQSVSQPFSQSVIKPVSQSVSLSVDPEVGWSESQSAPLNIVSRKALNFEVPVYSEAIKMDSI